MCIYNVNSFYILYFLSVSVACIEHLPQGLSTQDYSENLYFHRRLRGFWTEDIDNSDDENDPPPCYEQALRMYGLISIESAELEDQHQQGNSEDTRL